MTRATLFVCLSVLLAVVACGPVHAQDASEEATPASPPIQIIAPEAGCVATVGERLQVMILVQNDLEVSTVAVMCDGKGIGMLTQAPYMVEWDTSGLSPGDHVLRAFAYLTSGEKLGSAPVVVVLRDGDSAAPEATPEDEVAEQADSPPATAEQVDSSAAAAEPGKPQRLTDNDAQDTYPSWSPDGKKISFTSDRDGNSEIYVMNPDGSEQTNLTKDDRYVDAFSTWSPGGKYIAYTHQGRGWPRRIRIMNADGTGQHYPKESSIIPGLTKPVEGGYPSWCPDGNKIAFVGTRGITTSQLFGPDKIQLVPKIKVYSFSSKRVNYGPDAGAVGYDMAFLPSWLPNGAELLFASGEWRSAVSQIYRGPFRERGIRIAVTNGGGLKQRPSWSQDGKNVVFAARVSNNWDIYVLKYGEKTEVVRLTDHPASDRNPCWSPDGKKIAFESRRDGDNEIYVINLDPSSGGRIGLPPVEDLDGNAVHLPLDGKVTVLLYYPSWASYYREDEVKLLESETSLYPDVRGCLVFAAPDREEVAKEVREKGYRLAFLHDKMGELGKALNCTWQRRLYVVAGDGKMLFAEDPADEADTVIREAKAAVAKALDAKAEEQEASTGQ